MRAAVNGKLEVHVITEDDEFFQMEKEWNGLLGKSRSDTVFLAWEWLSSWWKAYGRGKKLNILQFKQNGQLIGLAPFYRNSLRKYKVFSFNTLAFIGDGSEDSDYMDFISIEGHEDTVVRSVVDYCCVNSTGWDLFQLNEIPDQSPHIALLRNVFREKGWFVEEERVPCAYVDMPDAWNQYIQSLKPRMRTKIRSITRKIEDDQNVGFSLCNDESELDGWLESFFELHNRRWKEKQIDGVFYSSSKKQFYNQMSSVFMNRKWLRFYALSLNNTFVAYQFCFEYKNKVYLLQEGFDPNLMQKGIGNVLRGYVFRDCIERAVETYDFLGGLTPHKLSWGASTKSSIRILAGPPAIKTILYFRLSSTIVYLKKVARHLLSLRGNMLKKAGV